MSDDSKGGGAGEATPRPSAAASLRDPRAAMLLVPVFFGGGMLVAGAAWLVTVLNTSGAARGDAVDVTFSSDCAAAAITARIDAYGLPGRWEGSTLRLTLAGTPGDEAVPAALAAPGKLVLRAAGADLPVVVERGGVQISFTGTAVSLFTFDAELPETGLSVMLDGAPMEVESVNSRELMIAARGVDSTEALRVAADRVTQVLHPLPCAVSVVAVAPAARL